MNGISEKDFEFFKERVYFWQKHLGLVDKQFIVKLKVIRPSSVYAEYESYPASGFIHITLNKNPNIIPDKGCLDKSAFHEVFESGYLSDLRHMAKSTWSNYEVEKETHRVVHLAQSSVFKSIKGE